MISRPDPTPHSTGHISDIISCVLCVFVAHGVHSWLRKGLNEMLEPRMNTNGTRIKSFRVRSLWRNLVKLPPFFGQWLSKDLAA